VSRIVTQLSRAASRWSDFGFGLCLSLLACGWVWSFAAAVGTGSIPILAGFTCGLVGIACGLAMQSRLFGFGDEADDHRWIVRCLLCAASVLAPGWVATVAGWITSGPVEAIASSASSFWRFSLVGLMTLTPAAMLATAALPMRRESLSRTFAGCATGLFVLPGTVVVWLGLNVATLCAATAYGILVAIRWNAAPLEQPTTASSSQTDVAPAPLWAAAVLSACAGVVMAVSGRWTFQLFLDAPVWIFARWAGLCLGIAFAVRMARLSDRRGLWFGGVVLAIASSFAVVAFGWLVHRSLDVAAYVSPVWLTLLIRGTMAAALPFAAGCCVGGCGTATGRRSMSIFSAACLAPAACGLLVEYAFDHLTPLCLVGSAFTAGLTALVLMIGELKALPAEAPRRGRQFAMAMSAAVVLLGLFGLVGQGRYRPDIAARLLFNSPVFGAYLNGQTTDQLVHGDGSRRMATIESRESTWTVWRQRDAYVQLRENGLARGLVSLDTDIAPQSAPDVVTTVLPLVLHRDPQHLLFLGMKAPATLATSLEFPLRTIRCVERDAAMRQIIETQLQPATDTSLFSDERVDWIQAEAVAAARADHGRTFDVIIAQDGQPLPWSTSPLWTQDYFRSVAGQLSEGGMFCQRLIYGDVSDRPVRDLAATLRSTFAYVTIIEPLPGELLFVCSNTEAAVMNEELVARLDRGHVRHALGRMGWDFSVLMGLAVIPAESTDAFIGQATANTASNGRFMSGLVHEVFRWGPKWNEVRDCLVKQTTTPLRGLGKESTELFDVSKRIEDIRLASQIVGEHPDEFWEYRKAIRDRLKDRPRTAIVQVKNEGLSYGLHAEDSRRKEYLKSLGTAVTAEAPTPAMLAETASFAEPFDPLMSPFVHEEVARLAVKSSPRDLPTEFDYWRHAIYFGTGNDRSVRNVVAAVELLHEHPECIADETQRWDAMQSLLEVMRERWTVRANLAGSGRSKFEAVDLSRSISAAEAAVGDLDQLALKVGPAAEGWETRKKVLQKQLIRDLESYRTRQEARAAAEKRVKAAENPLPAEMPSL
jgi:hypothetical protein